MVRREDKRPNKWRQQLVDISRRNNNLNYRQQSWCGNELVDKLQEKMDLI